VKDIRSLTINEKSEDTGSVETVSPGGQNPAYVPSLLANSKGVSPVDNNASYIDKSMTRQFDHLTLSPHTLSDQFESRKTSQESKKVAEAIKHRLDSNSSQQQLSVESAPEAALPEKAIGAGGLARVTSYNKLERGLYEEDTSQHSQAESRKHEHSRSADEEDKEGLKPGYDVIMLDQANIKLAQKLMDEDSMQSP